MRLLLLNDMMGQKSCKRVGVNVIIKKVNHRLAFWLIEMGRFDVRIGVDANNFEHVWKHQ